MRCPCFELSLRCVPLFNSPSPHSPAPHSSHVWDLAIDFAQNDVWMMFFIRNLSHWCWWVLHIFFFFNALNLTAANRYTELFRLACILLVWIWLAAMGDAQLQGQNRSLRVSIRMRVGQGLRGTELSATCEARLQSLPVQ